MTHPTSMSGCCGVNQSKSSEHKLSTEGKLRNGMEKIIHHNLGIKWSHKACNWTTHCLPYKSVAHFFIQYPGVERTVWIQFHAKFRDTMLASPAQRQAEIFLPCFLPQDYSSRTMHGAILARQSPHAALRPSNLRTMIEPYDVFLDLSQHFFACLRSCLPIHLCLYDRQYRI